MHKNALHNKSRRIANRARCPGERQHERGYPHALKYSGCILGAGLVSSAPTPAPLHTPIAGHPILWNGLLSEAAGGAFMDGPAPLPIQGKHQVMEGHQSGAVANGDAGAPQLLHLGAEPLLHVNLHTIKPNFIINMYWVLHLCMLLSQEIKLLGFMSFLA